MPVAAEPRPAAEAIAMSYQKEGVGGQGLSPEQRSAHSRGQEIRQKLSTTKDNDPLAALRKTESKPAAETNAKREENNKNLTASFGTEKKPAVDGTPAGDRLKKAQELQVSLQKYEDQGFDALLPNEQKDMIDAVVAGALKGRPAFDSLPVSHKGAIAEGLLSRPEVRAKVTELLAGKMTPEHMAKMAELVDNIATAETNKQAKEQSLKDKNTELADKNKAYREKRAEMKKFQLGGASFNRLLDLEMGGYVEDGFADKDAELMAALPDAAARQEEIDKVNRGEASDHQDLIEQWQFRKADMDELTELRARRDALPGESDALKDDINRIIQERNKIHTEIGEADDAVTAAEDAKAAQEEDLLKQMEGIMNEAADIFIDEDIAERYRIAQEMLNADLVNAKSEDEKKWKKAIDLGDRWNKYKVIKGRRVPTINKDAVKRDYARMIQEGGPEGILRDMLVDTIDARPGTPEYDEAVRRVEDQLTDGAFREASMQKIGERIVTDFMLSGNKPLPDEVRMFRHSEWGTNLIKTALKEKAGLEEEIGKMDDEGVLGNRNTWNRIARNAKKGSWLAALALLLTGGIGGALKDSMMQRRAEF